MTYSPSLFQRFAQSRRTKRGNALLLDAVIAHERRGFADTFDQVQMALNAGADPNVCFGQGSTLPLEWAIHERLWDVVTLLLSMGADANPTRTVPSGWVPHLTTDHQPNIQVSMVTYALLQLSHPLKHDIHDAKVRVFAQNAVEAFLNQASELASSGPERPDLSVLQVLAYEMPCLTGWDVAWLRRMHPQAIDREGNTAAHTIATKPLFLNDAQEAVQALLRLDTAGANLLTPNDQGITPFSLVAERVKAGGVWTSTFATLLEGSLSIGWNEAPLSTTGPLITFLKRSTHRGQDEEVNSALQAVNVMVEQKALRDTMPSSETMAVERSARRRL